jgi:hypothetical protein
MLGSSGSTGNRDGRPRSFLAPRARQSELWGEPDDLSDVERRFTFAGLRSSRGHQGIVVRRSRWVTGSLILCLSAVVIMTATPVGAIAPLHVSTPMAGSKDALPSSALQLAAVVDPGAELGAYEWDNSTWWPDPSAYTSTLSQLQALGVNTLYVDITEAVTMIQHHSTKLQSFVSDFASLVREADNDGFRVDALGGDPTWATTSLNGPNRLLSAVRQIIALLPTGALDGVQFDVEPWSLPSWHTHAAARSLDWLKFIQHVVSTWSCDKMMGRLGFTVPYWFDGSNGNVPEVTFDGSKGYPFQLALPLLAPLDDTVLNVMAYRNFTAGSNGSIALFDPNMAAVVAEGSSTNLLLGQETGNVRPPDVTFYGLGCSAFETAASQLHVKFDPDPNYAGDAVDDVETMLALCPS